MDNKQVLKQIIQFNKMTFDNGFYAMRLAQEQGEKMLNTFLDQGAWLPEDGKRTVKEWVKAYQKGVGDFKAAVDDQYRKVEQYLEEAQ